MKFQHLIIAIAITTALIDPADLLHSHSRSSHNGRGTRDRRHEDRSAQRSRHGHSLRGDGTHQSTRGSYKSSRRTLSSRASSVGKSDFWQSMEVPLTNNNCYWLCMSKPGNISGKYHYSSTDNQEGCLCRHGKHSRDTSFYGWDSLAKTKFVPTEDCTIMCQLNEKRNRKASFGAFYERQNRPPECACYDDNSITRSMDYQGSVQARYPITDAKAMNYVEGKFRQRWDDFSDAEKYAIKEKLCRRSCDHGIGYYFHFCSCYSKHRGVALYYLAYKPQSDHLEID